MLKILKTWGVAALIFVGLDMLWLGKIMSKQYTEKLGYLANLIGGRIKFNLPVGLLTQLIIVTGLVFILIKSLNLQSAIWEAILTGAVVGFVIYATYDLTNLSFVKDWPLDITLVDIAWGTFQGIVAGITVWYLYFRK